MNITNTLRKSIQGLVFVCLPGLLYAQKTGIEVTPKTPASVMGRQVNRVPDPLSKNTIWIDKYTTKSEPPNQQKEANVANIVVFHFRVSSIIFEPNYMDNATSMKMLDKVFSDSTLFQNNKLAVIIGSASPEGTTDFNEVLARGRSLATKKYIMDRYPNIDRDKILTYAVDEDWQGLRTMIMNDIYMPSRTKAIEILDSESNSKQKLNALQKLNEGTTYRYIKANIFPYLRGGVSCTFYTVDTLKNEAQIFECPDTDTIYIEKLIPIIKNINKQYCVAIKTNALYDAALLPNLAIELPLGKRWSVELEGMHSWWNTKDDKPYRHRIQTAGLEVRKWLGSQSKKPLNGHFFGIYGMAGTYDVKYKEEKGVLSNWSYSAGISYGYAMPIAHRFNLEFALGLGYVGGEYKDYTFDSDRNCYSTVDGFNRSYFGPTKAKISLVWLIGSCYNNRTKR